MNININAKKIGHVVNVEGDATVNGRTVSPRPPAARAVQPTPERRGVFVSYAHADREWLDRFRTVLAPLVRSAAVPVWWDGEIDPGESWAAEIQKAMESASVAVMFVSPHLLASTFVMDVEMPYLLGAARSGRLALTWIPLRKCLVKETPLHEYQALHDPGQALNALTEPELDRALVLICEKLRGLIPVAPIE